MAKLADALASGASGREVVQVQVLFRAPNAKATLNNKVAFALGVLLKRIELKLSGAVCRRQAPRNPALIGRGIPRTIPVSSPSLRCFSSSLPKEGSQEER
jgi:hypothetical protein